MYDFGINFDGWLSARNLKPAVMLTSSERRILHACFREKISMNEVVSAFKSSALAPADEIKTPLTHLSVVDSSQTT